MTIMGLQNLEKVNEEFEGQGDAIKQSQLFWQPRASERLNAEDARQMIENVTGFIAQLAAWDAAEKAGGSERSNFTAISPEAVKKPLNQEETDCSRAHNSLVA